MRPIDTIPWRRFEFVLPCTEPTSVPIGRGVLDASEINAASNATIIIDRMLRNGRRKIQ